jgi:hypothetical protein
VLRDRGRGAGGRLPGAAQLRRAAVYALLAASALTLLVVPIVLVVTGLGAAAGTDTAFLVLGLLLVALGLDYLWLR